ncbi:hypothetical protein AAY473_014570 [Plecturocebus cupreus]
MGPAEPVPPVYSALGSAALGADKRAALAKRVALATRVASLPGILRSVGNKNSSEIQDQPGQHGKTPSIQKIQKVLGMVVHTSSPSYLGESDREIPGGEATRVAGATLLAGEAVLPAPSVALPGAEYKGRTGSAGPIPTRKTAIGSAEDGEFHSGRSEPGKRGTGVRQRKTKKQKNFITGRREIQNGRVAAARDCGSR